MKRNTNKATGAALSKKRRSFNFIDVILILLALLIVLTVVNIFSPMLVFNKLRNDLQTTIQYTLEVKGVDNEFINKINENDTVVDTVSKYSLGSVTAVDYNMQYLELEYDEAQRAGVMAVHPDKYNVIITITASAAYNEGKGYSVNGHRIAVGEMMSVRFPDYVCEGYCIGLSVIS